MVRLIITIRKRSCGKVMFSQACVKNSVHREGVSARHHPSRRLLQRTARILLQCILVPTLFQNDGQLHDVYIVCNLDHNDKFLHEEIVPLLESCHITYVTEDSSVPGRNKFTCLQNSMTQSRAALVVISRDLLKENWELYQLNQAVYTEIHQKHFKVQ